MHIGQKIREVMKQKRMTAVAVSNKVGCERTNLYNIFERKDINTQLLQKLSVVLNYDFFRDLSRDTFTAAEGQA